MIRYASASELPCEPAWASEMDGRVCARAKANNVAWTIRGAELASFIFTETSCAARVIGRRPSFRGRRRCHGSIALESLSFSALCFFLPLPFFWTYRITLFYSTTASAFRQEEIWRPKRNRSLADAAKRVRPRRAGCLLRPLDGEASIRD